MKLEDQVTGLELSLRLFKLGVKQDAYFCWFRQKGSIVWDFSETWQIDDEERFETISAFTVAELGEMLPGYTSTVKDHGSNLSWMACYPGTSLLHGGDFRAKKEVDSRAKIIIHLLEKGLSNAAKDNTERTDKICGDAIYRNESSAS